MVFEFMRRLGRAVGACLALALMVAGFAVAVAMMSWALSVLAAVVA